jgi:hypothetical protein
MANHSKYSNIQRYPRPLVTRWDEEARRLRQSRPFCGILSEGRRMEICKEFEEKLR